MVQGVHLLPEITVEQPFSAVHSELLSKHSVVVPAVVQDPPGSFSVKG
jgi:hypothetical protein